MRNTFINYLTECAETNDKIILIVGDLGYSVVEDFQKKFPNRFFNAGICEQSMASMAAGLASEGYHVFIYSIANFPTFRCAEQLRNDVGYHNNSVTVVSVGGGLSYGNLGYSHHAIQDLGLMRLFPEFLIAAPGDPIETEMCLKFILANPSPSYLRLKKAGEPNYNVKKVEIVPGLWNEIISSKNNKILLSTGGGLNMAIKLINSDKKYKEYGLYSCPIWGAKYRHNQEEQLNKFDEIITIEDHLLDCGFGSWIRESIVIPDFHLKLINKGLSENVIGRVGTEEYLLTKDGY
jgi:transketolase